MMFRTLTFTSFMWLFTTAWLWSGDATSGWEGLWRLEQRSTLTGSIVSHLFVPDADKKAKTILYRFGWQEQPTEKLEISGNQLKIRLDLSGKPVKLDAERNGNQLTGEWLLFHPQYPHDGALKGFRVHGAGDWELFGGLKKLRTEQGFIDFAGFLARESPPGEQAFVKFWEETVVPEFYTVIHDFVYGEKIFDRELPKDQVRSIQRIVQRPEFKESAVNFAKVYEKVRKDLAKEYEEMGLLNSLIRMPPMKGFKSQTREIAGGLITLVDVQAETKRWSAEQLPYFIAQQVFMTPILLSYPTMGAVALEIYKDGVRSYLAGRLKYSSDPSSRLLLSEGDIGKVGKERSKYSREIEENLMKAAPVFIPDLFEKEPRPGRVLGHSFAESLAQKFSPKELMEMEVSDVYKEAETYFGSIQ